jgi:hypothetical protein
MDVIDLPAAIAANLSQTLGVPVAAQFFPVYESPDGTFPLPAELTTFVVSNFSPSVATIEQAGGDNLSLDITVCTMMPTPAIEQRAAAERSFARRVMDTLQALNNLKIPHIKVESVETSAIADYLRYIESSGIYENYTTITISLIAS